jgi:hypothetical protein
MSGEILTQQMAFVKLYGRKLLRSSLWFESPTVLKLFIYMLCEADLHGVVDVPSVKALAHNANLSHSACVAALLVLTSPDPISRTQAHEGRRVLPRDEGGWVVVNAVKYRKMQTVSQVKKAAAQARWRAKSKPATKAPKPRREVNKIKRFDEMTDNRAPDYMYEDEP